MTDTDKLNLQSLNIPEEKREELLRIFPEVRTEGGQIDFDRLRLALGDVVDTGKERYGLNWPGKAACFKAIQTPSMGTLLPAPEESVNFDTTENLIIEGDNLEALKLLQKSYIGKVKMIYIDPPYNTGNEFIYPDNYSESLQTYLEYTGQTGEEGKRFSSNTDTDGRFHSKWLNMMYPRLYLARDLLRDDGVIFISIDDHEQASLEMLAKEVYGEENIIGVIANTNNPKGRSDDSFLAVAHEYIIVVAKNKEKVNVSGFEPDDIILRRYNKIGPDGRRYREIDLRKTGDADRREDRPDSYYFFIYDPESGKIRVSQSSEHRSNEVCIEPVRADDVKGRWRWGYDTSTKNIQNLIAKRMPNRNIWGIFEKDYLDDRDLVKPTSSWTFKDVNSERGTEQLLELGISKEVFLRPKPLGTLKRVLEIGTAPSEPCIVLDFFAGSGGVAHAAMELFTSGKRQISYMLVQLPERLDENKKEQKDAADFCYHIKKPHTIAEITKERVRRVIKKLNDEDGNEKHQDRGFRVFKLAESNFTPWDGSIDQSPEALSRQMEMHIEHVRQGRTDEDILYEILLKSGFPLSIPIQTLQMTEKTVYSIHDGLMLICLDRNLTMPLVQAIVDRLPERVVFLDEGFAGNDALKVNAKEACKLKNIVFKVV